jgi:hypothetical protein
MRILLWLAIALDVLFVIYAICIVPDDRAIGSYAFIASLAVCALVWSSEREFKRVQELKDRIAELERQNDRQRENIRHGKNLSSSG